MPIQVTHTAVSHIAAAAQHTAAHHAAGGVLGSITRNIGHLPAWMTAAVVFVMVIVPLLAIILLRHFRSMAGQLGGRTAAFMFYDPSEHALRMRAMTEIAPNAFATRDGKLVALVESSCKPVDFTKLPLDKRVLREYPRGYYGYRVGSVLLTVDPLEELSLSITGRATQTPIRSVADLLTALYTEKLVTDMPVSPAMRLVMVVDNKKAGELIASDYGRHAEEALVDISATTGKTMEFEQRVRQMIELEKQKMQAVSGAVAKILAIVFIMVIALVFVMNMFHH